MISNNKFYLTALATAFIAGVANGSEKSCDVVSDALAVPPSDPQIAEVFDAVTANGSPFSYNKRKDDEAVVVDQEELFKDAVSTVLGLTRVTAKTNVGDAAIASRYALWRLDKTAFEFGQDCYNHGVGGKWSELFGPGDPVQENTDTYRNKRRALHILNDSLEEQLKTQPSC